MAKRVLDDDNNNNNNNHKRYFPSQCDLLPIKTVLQHIYTNDNNTVINWDDIYSPINYRYVQALELLCSTCTELQEWRPSKNEYLRDRRKIPPPILNYHFREFRRLECEDRERERFPDDLDWEDICVPKWEELNRLISHLPPNIQFGDLKKYKERTTLFFGGVTISNSPGFSIKILDLSDYDDHVFFFDNHLPILSSSTLLYHIFIETILFHVISDAQINYHEKDRPHVARLFEACYKHNPKDPTLLYIAFVAMMDIYTIMNTLIGAFLDFLETIGGGDDGSMISDQFLGAVCMLALLNKPLCPHNGDSTLLQRLRTWLDNKKRTAIFSTILHGYLICLGNGRLSWKMFNEKPGVASTDGYSLWDHSYQSLYMYLEMAMELKCLPLSWIDVDSSDKRPRYILVLVDKMVRGFAHYPWTWNAPADQQENQKEQKHNADSVLLYKLFDYIEEHGLSTDSNFIEFCRFICSDVYASKKLRDIIRDRGYVRD